MTESKIKSCSTCEHRAGLYVDSSICMKTGCYCTTQRKIPVDGCDVNFSGWEPRRGVFIRIKEYFKG